MALRLSSRPRAFPSRRHRAAPRRAALVRRRVASSTASVVLPRAAPRWLDSRLAGLRRNTLRASTGRGVQFRVSISKPVLVANPLEVVSKPAGGRGPASRITSQCGVSGGQYSAGQPKFRLAINGPQSVNTEQLHACDSAMEVIWRHSASHLCAGAAAVERHPVSAVEPRKRGGRCSAIGHRRVALRVVLVWWPEEQRRLRNGVRGYQNLANPFTVPPSNT
jgi:hypothetical protein